MNASKCLFCKQIKFDNERRIKKIVPPSGHIALNRLVGKRIDIVYNKE